MGTGTRLPGPLDPRFPPTLRRMDSYPVTRILDPPIPMSESLKSSVYTKWEVISNKPHKREKTILLLFIVNFSLKAQDLVLNQFGQTL